MSKTPSSWMPIMGSMVEEGAKIIFNGGTNKIESGESIASVGLFVSDIEFNGGTVSMDVVFTNPTPKSACDIVLFHNPYNNATINTGIGNDVMYSVRAFDTKWHYHAQSGPSNGLLPNKPYRIKAKVNGSRVSLIVNDVHVLNTTLPHPFFKSQVGLLCVDHNSIIIDNYMVVTQQPSAFVVMQFSSPYNDVYTEVIQRICSESGVKVHRIDEKVGPGLIIADINRAITESHLIIADISPINANVYYEVGFAHAINKPTILLAEIGCKLPFDVSPFRTIFYENTIAGKRKLEEGLRTSIKSILFDE